MIKSLEPVITKTEESYFKVILDSNRIMEVPMWSFYMYLSEEDENLSQYAGKFPEWEQLTNDLLTLEFPFITKMIVYLNQFTEEQIEDFSFSPEEY
jgi:hypothetical protein